MSSLHGHGDVLPAPASGCPTECSAGTKSPSLADEVEGGLPMRVMMRIDTTTYGESVSSDAELGDARAERAHREGDDVHRAALHAPANFSLSVARMATGRPVVGRAGVLLAAEQMKVRSRRGRRRAGLGARQEGVQAGLLLRRMNVPPLTICW